MNPQPHTTDQASSGPLLTTGIRRIAAPGYMPAPGTFRDMRRRVIGAPNLLRRLQFRQTLSFLGPGNGRRLLEVGCGQGWMSAEASRAGFRVIASDPYRDHGWSAWKGCGASFVQADGARLPFRDYFFDRILLLSVLPVVSKPDPILKECARVLSRSPGSRLVLSAPGPFPRLARHIPEEELRPRLRNLFHADGPMWFTQDEIGRILERNGLKITRTAQTPGAMTSALWQAAIRRGIFSGREPSLKWMFFKFYPFLWWDRGSAGSRAGSPWGGEWLIAAELLKS